MSELVDFVNWFHRINFSNQRRLNQYIRILERVEEIFIHDYYQIPPEFRDQISYRKTLSLLNLLIVLLRND